MEGSSFRIKIVSCRPRPKPLGKSPSPALPEAVKNTKKNNLGLVGVVGSVGLDWFAGKRMNSVAERRSNEEVAKLSSFGGFGGSSQVFQSLTGA